MPEMQTEILYNGGRVIDMKEIKFRAWDTKNKEMGVVHILNLDSCFADASFHNGRTLKGHIGTDLILLEFTGLKDKNGKEIFEGDIVECDDIIYIIEWRNNYSKYVMNPIKKEIGKPREIDAFNWVTGVGYDNTLIIGNIYEKPKLLNKE